MRPAVKSFHGVTDLIPSPFTILLRRGAGLPGFENWSDFVLELLNEFRVIAEIPVGYVQHSDDA
jgi:hypothetical protein